MGGFQSYPRTCLPNGYEKAGWGWLGQSCYRNQTVPPLPYIQKQRYICFVFCVDFCLVGRGHTGIRANFGGLCLCLWLWSRRTVSLVQAELGAVGGVNISERLLMKIRLFIWLSGITCLLIYIFFLNERYLRAVFSSPSEILPMAWNILSQPKC